MFPETPQFIAGVVHMKVRTQFFEACNKYITNYWIDKIEEAGYYQIERNDDYIKITWKLHCY